jgi:hypothetical protein
VIAAAMIAPTAMPIEKPVLPDTCAAKSVAISAPRRRSGEPADGSEVTRSSYSLRLEAEHHAAACGAFLVTHQSLSRTLTAAVQPSHRRYYHGTR